LIKANRERKLKIYQQEVALQRKVPEKTVSEAHVNELPFKEIKAYLFWDERKSR